MILRRLKLKNYRKFVDLDLEFPEGFICIVGRNGMGKTTLVEAVAFALYGSVASRTGATGVRTRGVGEPCVVEMDFSVGNEPYRVVRRLRGEGEIQSAEMYRGSGAEPVATGARAVDGFSAGLLGMDFHTFLRSVFARQKEIHALSQVEPAKRREMIRRMIGIDRIDGAIAAVRRDGRETRAAVEAVRALLADLPRLQEESREAARKGAAASKRLDRSRAAVERARGASLAAREKLRQLGDVRRVAEELTRDLARAEAEEEKVRERSEALKIEANELKVLDRELRSLKGKVRKYEVASRRKERLDRAWGVHEAKAAFTAELGGLASELETAQEEAASIQKRAAACRGLAVEKKANANATRVARAAQRTARQALKPAREERARLSSRLDDLRGRLGTLRHQGRDGSCPLCERRLGREFGDILTHLAAEEKKASAERDRAGEKVKTHEEEERRVEGDLERLGREKEACAAKETEARRIDAELTAADRRVKQTKTGLAKRRESVRKLGPDRYDPKRHRAVLEEVKELRPAFLRSGELEGRVKRLVAVLEEKAATAETLVELRERKKELRERRRETGFQPKGYEKASLAAQRLEDRLHAAIEGSASCAQEEARTTEKAKALTAAVEQLRARQRHAQEEAERLRYLLRLETLLGEFRSELALAVKPLIAEHASRLFCEVTRGRYTRIELDDDYNISILDQGGLHPIRRFSGGEEDLANLSLRVAVSSVVAERSGGEGPSFLVLDEIFGSLDVERRETVLAALQTLTARFRQILLITHIEEIRERVPFLLSITETPHRAAEAQWVG